MRRGHFIILFAILFVGLLGKTLLTRVSYKNALEKKGEVDYALQMASDAAAEQLAMAYQSANIEDYLDSASVAFFRALTAGLGLYDAVEAKDELTYYVPAFLVSTTDGFYINYLSETLQDEVAVLERNWTECQPYLYSDDYFVYRFFLDDRIIVYEKNSGVYIKSTFEKIMSSPGTLTTLSSGKVFQSEESYYEYKRYAIGESIGSALKRTVVEHGTIAGQKGINAVYGVPAFFDSFSPAQEYPSFVAIFQGYPLMDYGRAIYNNAAASASYITVVPRFVVEKPNRLEQPFAVFHKENCSKIGNYGTVLQELFSLDDAVGKYGAYACPTCFSEDEGVSILP